MIEEYNKARRAGEREYKNRLAKGEYPFVPALDDIVPDNEVLGRRPVGLIEIPVWLIEGTKTRARQNSFAPGFMPLLDQDTEFAIKWSNLYNAQMEEGFNSPIKVYEYLHRFYVLEGNKRVSVSRFLDMPTIHADVTRIVPPEKVLEENPVYAEFLEFYKVCPLYDIVCTIPGSYREIAELLGHDPDDGERWSEEQVKALRTSFWNFSETVHALQSQMPDMPLGDAFLVYLRIYTGEALDHYRGKELDKRLLKIRKELLTVYRSYTEDDVSLMESSDEVVNAGSIITKTGSMITRPGSILGKVLPVKQYSEKNPLKAAFIYDRRPEDSDWIYNHDFGRRRMEQTYGGLVITKAFIGLIDSTGSDAPEGTTGTEAAIREAAEWGADVIFTVSPRQMKYTLRAAIEREDIIFLNCSVNLAHQAVRTYYAKLYEAKFLAGVAAAVEAERIGSHRIGYVSDYPIFGTIACINAFAIGAAMIDPDVRIYLEWSTKQDNDWWHSMEKQGIDVISAFDSTHRVDGSNVYGVFRLERTGRAQAGDQNDAENIMGEPGAGPGEQKSGPKEQECKVYNIAAPIWKWGKLYEIIIRTILEGKYHASLVDRKDQATNYWWGMISGVVDIELSDDLSPYTRQLIELLRSNIISGTVNPFDGELKSQTGWVRRKDEPELTSKDIIMMDWLNENVIGEIPEKATLNDEAKSTVSVSGVK